MGQEKGKNDDLIFGLLVIFVTGMFLVGSWFVFHEQIASGTRWIRVGQLYIYGFFNDDYEPLRQRLIALHPDQITFTMLHQLNLKVTGLLKIVFAVILGILASIAFFLKSGTTYKRRMTIDDIIDEHAKGFPVITPIVKSDPMKAPHRILGQPVPAKLPPWSEALAPEEWIAFHAVPMPQNQLDRTYARLAFAKQLRGRWQGSAKLPWHLKALFAAFSMKANGERQESDEFLAKLSTYWDPKKGLNLDNAMRKEITKVLRDPKRGMVSEKIARQHAFVATAMLRMLKMARDNGGVLASAQFLWLRPLDRTLWYPLNNLGRGATHTESSGAIAHFRAELAADKPIPNPQLDSAVDALIAYLEEENPPIPPRQ